MWEDLAGGSSALEPDPDVWVVPYMLHVFCSRAEPVRACCDGCTQFSSCCVRVKRSFSVLYRI